MYFFIVVPLFCNCLFSCNYFLFTFYIVFWNFLIVLFSLMHRVLLILSVYLWCVVYVHVSVYVVCMSACRCECMYWWRPKVDIRCLSQLLFHLALCVYTCVLQYEYVHVCIDVLTLVDTYREARGCYQLSSSVAFHLIFRQGLSLNLELSVFARVTGQGISGICLFSPPHSQVLRFILSSQPSCEHGYWVT